MGIMRSTPCVNALQMADVARKTSTTTTTCPDSSNNEKLKGEKQTRMLGGAVEFMVQVYALWRARKKAAPDSSKAACIT
jgi:hypothetical protein